MKKNILNIISGTLLSVLSIFVYSADCVDPNLYKLLDSTFDSAAKYGVKSDDLKTAIKGGVESDSQFFVFSRTRLTPTTSLAKHYSPSELIGATDVLVRSSTKAGGLRVHSEAKLALFFQVPLNGYKFPEGIIQRNDHKFTTFEVKNQNEFEMGKVIEKFQDIDTLAKKETLQIGRYDLFLRNDTTFADAHYFVKDGFLHDDNGIVTIVSNNLPIFIHRKDFIPE
jgi:hypothetical protein